MPCTEPPFWWVERWPAALVALSFDSRVLALDDAELHALGRANGIGTGLFRDPAPGVLAALQARLDAVLAEGFTHGAFVRLGSRSAKDAPPFHARAGRAFDGAGVLALLAAGSRRIAFDLRRCVREGWPAALVLREWQAIDPGDEWRGLIEAGELVGLCPAARAAAPAEPALAAARIAALAARIAPHLPDGRVVFDAWLPPGAGAAVLVDLNPWGAPTDAVLFDWQQPFDRTLRWAAQRRPL